MTFEGSNEEANSALRSFLTETLIAGSLVDLVVVLICVLNANRFCFSEGRFISDQEAIFAAINRTIAERSFIVTEGGATGVTLKSIEVERFPSAEAFLAANPNCCHLRIGGAEGHPPVTLAQRALGTITEVAVVEFIATSKERSEPRRRRIERHWPVNSCGRVV